MIQQFRQFAQGMTPQGAKAQIDQMLQSGQISKSDIDSAMELAKQFQGFLK